MIGIGLARKALDAAWQWLFGYDIFITFTRRDGELYARALKAALDHEYLVFLDHTGIAHGQSIPERIKREIKRCRMHVVALTPAAVDENKAPWVAEEVELHFKLRRRFAILTIFFPPNAPWNLPHRLQRLKDYKGVFELPGAEISGSPSLHVLDSIAGRKPWEEVNASWAHAANDISASLLPRHEGEIPLHPVGAIREAFTSVRQRTRMTQAAAVALVCFLATAAILLKRDQVTRDVHALASVAEKEESALRYHDAEVTWRKAMDMAWENKGEYRAHWQAARSRRLLTPIGRVTLPPGWSLRAIGTRGQDWSLLVHRLHDNDQFNGAAALVNPRGEVIRLPAQDDFTPRALFQEDATYVHAAGRIFRIPQEKQSGATEPQAELGLRSYQTSSAIPQIELGWKDGKLCVLAGLERPPRVFLLEPVNMTVLEDRPLTLPVDLIRPGEEPDDTDRFGEALFRISTRNDTLVTSVWRRHTQNDVGVMSWALDFTPRPTNRKFALPMGQIGQMTIPDLDSLELSPEDKQVFLRITALNLFGTSVERAGRDFWIALDTASARPPWLMDSLISRVWPLHSHQSQEAYYLADGDDLRALTFSDFVVTKRPSVGIMRQVRAGALLPTGPTLAAATAEDLVLVRGLAPIFRTTPPQSRSGSTLRLNHVHADTAGHWVAAAFERNTDNEPQQIVIYRTEPSQLPGDVGRDDDYGWGEVIQPHLDNSGP